MRRLLILTALTIGCSMVHPLPGSACNAGDAVCQPGGAAIVCDGGHYVKTSCGGPAGCVMQDDRTVQCDQGAGAKANELCLPAYADKVECEATDKSLYLKCSSGKWVEGKCTTGFCSQASAVAVCQ